MKVRIHESALSRTDDSFGLDPEGRMLAMRGIVCDATSGRVEVYDETVVYYLVEDPTGKVTWMFHEHDVEEFDGKASHTS